MLEQLGVILGTGLKVFSEERRRYFSKKYSELLHKEQELKNATYPDHSQYDIDYHTIEVEIFIKAYGAEFSEAMKHVTTTSN